MSSFVESSNIIVNIESSDPTHSASGNVRNDSNQLVGVGSDIPDYEWICPCILDVAACFRGPIALYDFFLKYPL